MRWLFEKRIAEREPPKSFWLVLIEIASIWALADIGYYVVIPLLGSKISYDSSPIAIAVYFSVWAVFCILYFRKLYSGWFARHSSIWLYAGISLGCAGLIFCAIAGFSLLPSLSGPILAPYSDILLANPWYFLPKAIEILVQQLLITVLVLELYFRTHSLKKVISGYLLCFVGAHILQFLIAGAPLPYSIVMIGGAFLSAFIFPYLILRVRGGFIYVYMMHFLFYVFLAIFLHILPPPGYFA